MRIHSRPRRHHRLRRRFPCSHKLRRPNHHNHSLERERKLEQEPARKQHVVRNVSSLVEPCEARGKALEWYEFLEPAHMSCKGRCGRGSRFPCGKSYTELVACTFLAPYGKLGTTPCEREFPECDGRPCSSPCEHESRVRDGKRYSSPCEREFPERCGTLDNSQCGLAALEFDGKRCSSPCELAVPALDDTLDRPQCELAAPERSGEPCSKPFEHASRAPCGKPCSLPCERVVLALDGKPCKELPWCTFGTYTERRESASCRSKVPKRVVSR